MQTYTNQNTFHVCVDVWCVCEFIHNVLSWCLWITLTVIDHSFTVCIQTYNRKRPLIYILLCLLYNEYRYVPIYAMNTDMYQYIQWISICTNIYDKYRHAPIYTITIDMHQYIQWISICTNLYNEYRYVPIYTMNIDMYQYIQWISICTNINNKYRYVPIYTMNIDMYQYIQ